MHTPDGAVHTFDVDAARALLEAEGVSALTVKAVTDRADVGHGTFYHHFPSTEAVLAAGIEESMREFSKAMERGFGFVAHGGSYVLVSIVQGNISFSDPEFHKRETTLLSSRNATLTDFASGASWSGGSYGLPGRFVLPQQVEATVSFRDAATEYENRNEGGDLSVRFRGRASGGSCSSRGRRIPARPTPRFSICWRFRSSGGRPRLGLCCSSARV